MILVFVLAFRGRIGFRGGLRDVKAQGLRIILGFDERVHDSTNNRCSVQDGRLDRTNEGISTLEPGYFSALKARQIAVESIILPAVRALKTGRLDG